jgi:DNA-binding transcriptional regulator YiaG
MSNWLSGSMTLPSSDHTALADLASSSEFAGAGRRRAHGISGGVVVQWSGREVRALRRARRMSIRDFAGHLGVSDRMVSKWEAGRERIHPRQVNQAALDESLQRAEPHERERFNAVLSLELAT